MTNAARIYGNSLYDLAQEEGCVEPMAEQLQQIRTLFAENPEYVRLLGEPTIEAEKRRELMDEAFAGAEKLEDICRILVKTRAKTGDYGEPADFDTSKINIMALPFVKVVSDPYIMECCEKGKPVGSYIDDFAQIVGPDMQVVSNDEWAAERALLGYSTSPAPMGFLGKMPMTGALDRMGGQQPALNSTIGRNAVLVKGVGAVCAGKTEGDAEAIAMIVSKNCAAACYAKYARPLGRVDARLQRTIYLTKYSKQMDK